MSSRTYLSIGDVLTLLREEFPDVTISKIRFLESQGLVNPERSPSGYRKFFDHDVERLRWVLRQQREHFLPLKVIRDRLADGELDDPGLDAENGKPLEVDARNSTGGDEQPTKADEEAMARILADASRRAALMPEAAQARRGLQVLDQDDASAGGMRQPVASPAASATAGVADPTPSSAQRAPMSSASPPPGTGAERGAASASDPAAKGSGRVNGAAEPGRPGPPPAAPPPPPPPQATSEAAAAGPAASAPPSPPPRRGQAGDGEGATTGPSPPVVTGASMTAEEICAASGLSREELTGLQGFGLICPIQVAGMDTYDEEALTVANLAVAFRAFGIEPRHLRLYHNAADRELGLIEQVVIPLLRQRNPESRQRAVDSADRLAALGQSMRASLLRQALRRHFGG